MLYIYVLSDESPESKPAIFELGDAPGKSFVETGIPSLDSLVSLSSDSVSCGSRWGSVEVNVGTWSFINRFDPQKPPPEEDMPGGRVRSENLHKRVKLGHFLVVVFASREEAEAWDPTEVLKERGRLFNWGCYPVH